MESADSSVVRVAVETPTHTGLGAPLDYLSDRSLSPGTLVRVPLGKREVTGIVWKGERDEPVAGELKAVAGVLAALPVLPTRPTYWPVRTRSRRPTGGSAIRCA